MQKSFLKSLVIAAIAALAAIVAPTALAQVTTSGLTGVVRGSDGNPVSNASVVAVYTPTNASFKSTTNTAGRYYFRGLPVGGPYTVTVTADGYSSQALNDITTELGADATQDFALQSEVVKLERFVTTAGRNDLDSTALGAGLVLSNQRLATKPTSERSLADMVSATPLVTLRSTFGDREESQITAVGQNNRYNSIQIDGARINDQFGLNGTGLASFFNPLSLDTLEQLSVQVSPYDTRQSGFTGASINAVTKSGTNKFQGSAYYYFRGDHVAGYQMQGVNARENSLTGAKIIPKLERSTQGFTFRGPIWRDHIFFFVNYEKFQSTSAGRDPRFSTPSESAIMARLAQYNTASSRSINWGSAVTASTINKAEDKKNLAKIDWQINENHRASIRYSKTEGEVPQFGNFASGSSSINGVNGGITTSSDGHFYSQQRKEEAYSGQVFSQWTPNFKTELRYAQTKQDQITPLKTVAPMIYVMGLTGTDLINNSTVTNGTYIVGTEEFRHGNVINVETKQYSITGDYFWKSMVFSGGFEREQSDFYNLFRQGSYGKVAFRTLNDFLNDVNPVIQRNVYDPNYRPVADISDYATSGIFGQMKWDVNARLNILFGVRYEYAEADKRPALNQPFLATTGFRNDGSVDGTSTISPRLGFNWVLNEDRSTQVRGGIGHFLGRSPWVFFSNSFGATGVGTFTQFQPATSLTSYLKDQFDPTSPIGTAADNPSDATRRREVAWNDDGIKMPAVWRANIALDHKLNLLNSTISVEAVYSKVDEALFIRNENLKPSTAPAADGRARFSGAPSASNTSNARWAAYTDLWHASNVRVGQSSYLTVSWDRPMADHYAFNLSYTRGSSTEAQANGQTTASGYWQRNVVFNQGAVEVGRSDFEIRDRLQFSYTREFEVVKKWKTTASLYYEGRSGNPYSFVYSTDLNGDGRSDQDLVAVPSGQGDSRFDFSGMTQTQIDAMFAFIQSSGLSKYSGGVAPKNAFFEPWVNRLDLKLVQQVPVYGSAKLSLFFDFVNFGAFLSKDLFGYTEIAPGISNDVFRRRFLGGASYGTDGRIKPTFTSTPTGFNIDNGMSRWRIQVGAKLEF